MTIESQTLIYKNHLERKRVYDEIYTRATHRLYVICVFEFVKHFECNFDSSNTLKIRTVCRKRIRLTLNVLCLRNNAPFKIAKYIDKLCVIIILIHKWMVITKRNSIQADSLNQHIVAFTQNKRSVQTFFPTCSCFLRSTAFVLNGEKKFKILSE